MSETQTANNAAWTKPEREREIEKRKREADNAEELAYKKAARRLVVCMGKTRMKMLNERENVHSKCTVTQGGRG